MRGGDSRGKAFFCFLRFEFTLAGRGKHDAKAERESTATAGAHGKDKKILKCTSLRSVVILESHVILYTSVRGIEGREGVIKILAFPVDPVVVLGRKSIKSLSGRCR